jgi:hypothetical protein
MYSKVRGAPWKRGSRVFQAGKGRRVGSWFIVGVGNKSYAEQTLDERRSAVATRACAMWHRWSALDMRCTGAGMRTLVLCAERVVAQRAWVAICGVPVTRASRCAARVVRSHMHAVITMVKHCHNRGSRRHPKMQPALRHNTGAAQQGSRWSRRHTQADSSDASNVTAALQ